jgi:hypothetical protein
MSTPFITIHTVAYNEEKIVKYFIEHYRNRFPNCIIKIWDNFSKDNTVDIAKSMGCEVYYFDTDDKVCEDAILTIKNNCWKDATTDWVIVCDIDELLDISQDDLIAQEVMGYTIIQTTGYTVVNTDYSITELDDMHYGFRDYPYDKNILFNKKYISEIKYQHGAHPNYHLPRIIGNVNIGSTKEFKLLHYKWLGREYTINKRAHLRDRGISDFCKERNFRAEVVYEENEFPEWLSESHLNIYNRTDLIKIK